MPRLPGDVPEALISAFSYDDRVLLERRIVGRELAVGVIGSTDSPEALPIVEAAPKSEQHFDFEARYEIGKTDYVCPADLPAELTNRVQGIAVKTYKLLGCYGFARVDILLEDGSANRGRERGGPQVLEVQAIPGFTETSLFPQAAEAAGISFDQLVERLVGLALERDRAASTVG